MGKKKKSRTTEKGRRLVELRGNGREPEGVGREGEVEREGVGGPAEGLRVRRWADGRVLSPVRGRPRGGLSPVRAAPGRSSFHPCRSPVRGHPREDFFPPHCLSPHKPVSPLLPPTLSLSVPSTPVPLFFPLFNWVVRGGERGRRTE